MELGKIKARIREKGCNPSIPMVVPGSNKVLWVKVQKSALMDELDKVFLTKVSETGLMFDDQDRLTPVKAATVSEVSPTTPKANTIQTANGFTIELEDDDDLLSDDSDLLSDDDDLLA